MERLKFRFEIVKFKITVFMAAIGGGVYLFVNKVKFLDEFNVNVFYTICAAIIIYGVVGFVANLLEINDVKEKINE